MEKIYSPLPSYPLASGATCALPVDGMAQKVTLDSPALEVMTDLTRVFAETVGPDTLMAEAHRLMIRRGIRLLPVVDTQRRIVGLLTATDVLGEKPMQIIQHRGSRREDILVVDVMTPREVLQVLRMEDVGHSRVGHIVTSLKRAGRQHALVAESSADGGQRLRGIFSTSQIARQLGIALEAPHEIANTFAQIEATLSH